MTYEETLKYMFEALPMYQRIGKAAYKADLENAIELDNISGHSHRNYKIIHVAGTNGKGSVSHMLASVYQEAGYKVGLYTSPHLLDFRERIKVNGAPIDKNFVIKYIRRNQCFFEMIKPSFFEMTVFMAFCYFMTKEVDVAIIETGLGGRLDTTNIINPIASVITNIGLDHTHLLGNTLRLIAKEKAGIIKHQTPVVIGDHKQETASVFDARCELMEAPIHYTDNYFSVEFATRTTNGTQIIRLNNGKETLSFEIDLLGAYQQENIRTCLTALNVVQERIPVKDEHIKNGLSNVCKNTGLQGRWQEISYNPLVIADIAHNQAGLTATINQLENTPYKNLHMVLGFVNDKDIPGILKLFPKKAKYYFTKANIERSANPGEIYCMAKEINLSGQIFNDVKSAFEEASKNAEKEDLIYIGGSTFIVADFLKFKKK